MQNEKLIKTTILSVTLLSAALLANPVSAQSGTLAKIKKTGAITLGVRESSIPFSYIDDNQVYQGYALDLCKRVVAALATQLGLPKIEIHYKSVTSATRVPMMVNGSIDLECGSTTNNAERQKQVAFAPTTFLAATRFLAKKSARINGLADLSGKTLVSTAGTANLKELIALNAKGKLGINIVTAKDHAGAFAMVESGRAVAFGMDDILLASLAASSRSPNDYAISRQALTAEPYSIMLRRADPAFKKTVDAAITTIYTTIEIKRIYSRWFQSPLPGKGINLNWPMSEQLARNFARPSDSGDPASYR